MGKDSAYYKQLTKTKSEYIKEIKDQLPVHTHSFIDNCVLSYQIGTALGYARDLLDFYEYLHVCNPIIAKIKLNAIPHEIIEKLNSRDIDAYQTHLITARQLNERSTARKMAAIRNYFAYETRQGFLDEDITLKAAKNKRITKKTITRLDQHDVKSLVNAVENSQVATEHAKIYAEATAKRDLAIITLLLHTGMRVSECAGLDIDDVDFKDNTLKIVRKGGNESKLMINEPIRNTLRDYIINERPTLVETDSESALFISLKHNRMSVRSIQRMVEKYGKSSGLNTTLSPHKLRRTFGTALYNKTGDIYMVADVLGHSDINTTAAHYAAIDEEHKRQAADVDLYGENS